MCCKVSETHDGMFNINFFKKIKTYNELVLQYWLRQGIM